MDSRPPGDRLSTDNRPPGFLSMDSNPVGALLSTDTILASWVVVGALTSRLRLLVAPTTILLDSLLTGVTRNKAAFRHSRHNTPPG